MAKFIEEKEIIDSHIKSYVDTVTDFSKYLKGSPTFTTYYNKDMLASSADIGLSAVHEIVGTESPIRYKKINNFPIYNIGELPVQIDTDDEDGTDTNIEGEGVILPDCGIVPLIDDVFVIGYDSRKLVFRIVDVQISSIADKVLYKIEFAFTRWDLSILEEHQISKEFETRFDNIGKDNTTNKVVIEKTVDINISKLVDKKKELRDRYVRFFYNSDLNTFIVEDGKYMLYDNHLMEFIKRHNLFISKKTFMKNIFIEPLLTMTNSDIFNYERSIFYNIEQDEYRAWSLEPEYLDYTKIDAKFSIFDVYKYQYPNLYQVRHYHDIMLDNELKLDNRVKRYLLFLRDLNGDDGLNNNPTKKENELKDLTEDILDFKFTGPTETNYINIPLVMVIINKLIQNLESLN